MSVTSFIGQCFHNGVWGLCSRKATVNKYVQKAATRKWKYRDGKNDDEADGVVDVGDLAELEYSIVEQQPNAIVLKIDDQEPHRQESIDAADPGSTTISALLEGTDDLEEEELVTSPRVMSDIEEIPVRRSSSISSEKALIRNTSKDETQDSRDITENSTEDFSVTKSESLIEGSPEAGSDETIQAGNDSLKDTPCDINENIVTRQEEEIQDNEGGRLTKSKPEISTNNVAEVAISKISVPLSLEASNTQEEISAS